MKKIIILGSSLLITLLLLVGCSLSNTPTSKVEDLMSKYQRLDDDIVSGIDEVISSETLTSKQKERYKKIISDQYKNLTYEIKDEMIDGDKAIVTVQIEVLDYRKAISELNSSLDTNYDVLEYNDKKLDKLENVNDKVSYTLEINVLKDDNGNWNIADLTNTDIKKIQGMY